MIMKLKDGDVELELYSDVAPNHVKRFKELAQKGSYDGVVFHRVIEGFMAQTGDVKFGNTNDSSFNLSRAGTGGSVLIIGSAAGVAVMGILKIDFIWYLKNISFLAIIGYAAGAMTYILMQ